MTISWDTTILPFQSVMFARRNLSRSGGLTISGIEQVVQSSSDFWEAQATIKIRTREQIFAYRSYQAQNWGRAGQWLIPVCDAPTTIAGGGGFSRGFSSGFQIGQQQHAVDIIGRVTHTASRGDTSITFGVGAAGFGSSDIVPWKPIPGRFFSVGSRLYLIGTVSSSPLLPAGAFTVTFVPHLRAAVSLGETLDFSHPKCLMRLAQDNVGQMNLDMLRFADVSLNFVEVPT